MRRETVENALETLRKFDTIIIVDDSSSMAGAYWEEAGNALASLAQVAGQYDVDGVDVHFLNNQTVGRNMRVSRKFGRHLYDALT
jgi:gentisate 1,2-dioxygenase